MTGQHTAQKFIGGDHNCVGLKTNSQGQIRCTATPIKKLDGRKVCDDDVILVCVCMFVCEKGKRERVRVWGGVFDEWLQSVCMTEKNSVCVSLYICVIVCVSMMLCV